MKVIHSIVMTEKQKIKEDSVLKALGKNHTQYIN